MDPPPTAQPCRMVTCLKKRMLKKPRRPTLGRQNQRWTDQLVRGSLSGVQRRPISMTATLYPLSTSRRAETLPPKPEPMTMKSKSNWLSRYAIRVHREAVTDSARNRFQPGSTVEVVGPDL